MAAKSNDNTRMMYELSKEEWEAMISDRTSQERRQQYFREFRERIYHFWFMDSDGPPRNKDGSDTDDFKVEDNLE